jgi:hypothetical protein
MNYNNNSILEKNVLREINKLQITFDYNSNVTAYRQTVVGACGAVVREVLSHYSLSHSVNQMKLTLNAKRQRYKTESEYKECLENNIIFNLYEYDCFIKIFNLIGDSAFDLDDIDLDSYYLLVVEDAQKKIASAKQFSLNNKAVQELLKKYAGKDAENREFDYIFSSLKALLIRSVVKSVLLGEIESSGVTMSLKTYFQQFSTKDIIATFDFVITHEIAIRLNDLY